jgi:hypothetical protein
VVDKRMAEQFHIQPGDTLRVSTASGGKPLDVVTWPNHYVGHLSHVQPPYLYTLDKTFQSLFPDAQL